jgi:hypothetical protein
MKNLVRSVKYLIAFAVLYLGVVWISVTTTKGFETSMWDYILATFATTKGKLLLAAVVALAAAYPRFGFMSRRVARDMQQERDYIVQVFAAAGFSLKQESEGCMVFGANNILDRVIMLFEDEICVKQQDQEIEISGIRRGVARVLYRM